MSVASPAERSVLDELEPRWRKLGYTLVRDPSPDQLPSFLRGMSPDAIATGPGPSLLIEVLRARGGSADTKVRQLQGLIKDRDDWRLEAIYMSADGAPLKAVRPEDMRSALCQVCLIAKTEPRAALLLAWATFEAIGRYLEPSLGSRGMSPGSLVDLLIANGHVFQTDDALLRRLGELRNTVAHGQIDTTPSPEDIHHLVKLGLMLLGQTADQVSTD